MCSVLLSFLILLALLLLGVLVKLYLKLTTGWCRSNVCLVGKTVIVTGANIGIGYETALDFAKRGAKVILACRNEEKAEEARSKIVEETGNQNVHVRLVDFASFDSVRAFAKKINESEDRLDILVNNAGVINLGNKRTEDGRLILMQVNYFSSFLLTVLLIKLLKKSSPSRVVNVSSMAATHINSLDLSKIDEFAPYMVDYLKSKLCNVLFTMELDKKLQGTGVTTYSVHPGLVKTNIFHYFKGFASVMSISPYLFGKTCEEGAQTTLYCALAKDIESDSGSFFSDCRKYGPFKMMTEDPELPKKLWEKTEQLVNLKPDELQF